MPQNRSSPAQACATVADLQARLNRAMRETFSDPPRSFIPKCEVIKILTVNKIATCLGAFGALKDRQLDVERFAKMIADEYILIFATLLIDAQEEHIFYFINWHFPDTKLPFHENALTGLHDNAIKPFIQRQWDLIPLTLKTTGLHIKLSVDEKMVIPIVSNEPIGKGASGSVWRSLWASGCADEHRDVEYARKEIKRSSPSKTEFDVLCFVQRLKHPNIIEFVGHYSQGDTVNLLFPLASMNLEKFLLGSNPTNLQRFSIYNSIAGIADALRQIHDSSIQVDGHDEPVRNFGIHFDLYPENILIHQDTFKISDFGLYRFFHEVEAPRTAPKNGMLNFVAPECCSWTGCTTRQDHSVNSSVDVWSLGCVLCEVATIVGGKTVDGFRRRRHAEHTSQCCHMDAEQKTPVTSEAFHLSQQAHPEVKKWLDELVRDSDDQQLQPLVDVCRSMLNPLAHLRPSMKDLVPKLQAIALEASWQAVDERFTALAVDCVFARLECCRLRAWHKVYQKVDKSSIPASLKMLIQLIQLIDSGSGRQIPRELEDTTGNNRPLLTMVDTLCDTLRPHWDKFLVASTAEVCEIEDPVILEAIRQKSKPERYRMVGSAAAMKRMALALTNALTTGKKSRYLDAGLVQLDEEYEHGQPPDQSKALGDLTLPDESTVKVLVEWRVYDSGWGSDPDGQTRTMNNLVNQLDPDITPRLPFSESLLPHCCGYFHQQNRRRFGFVYRVPYTLAQDTLAQGTRTFKSLHEFISLPTDAEEASNVPGANLDNVFILARDLASCLSEVHQTGWLHKSFSSHQIIIFASGGKFSGSSLESALIMGFNDSRQESGVTLGPKEDDQYYRDPQYVPGTTFRKAFDYFSLGIVLLELGRWQTVATIREELGTSIRKESIRQKILSHYVQDLGPLRGSLYRDAVSFCLDAEAIMGNEKLPMSELPKEFQERVVNRLSRCCF